MVKTQNDKKVYMSVGKIIQVGNALGISVPKEWAEANRVKVGDKVLIKIETLK
ncbi:MAG: AbrB/MazE/SpoVT family DNA-binding domain-containing protein [Nanoarchaeota archaeon]|nr:AbrB/MazE/SpoVT family DNA-binding domain-containing protein [Nanoarchaeota archaeon]